MNTNIFTIGFIAIIMGISMMGVGFIGASLSFSFVELVLYIAVCSAGIIIVIIGIILLNVAFESKEKHPQYPQQYRQPVQQQSRIKYCKNCNAQLDINWVSCPYCNIKQS